MKDVKLASSDAAGYRLRSLIHFAVGDSKGGTSALERAATGVTVTVAAGDVHMHLRSRRRLQDVLTAIRLGKPVAQCGQALYPNAERSLRLRVRLAQLYPPESLAETVAILAGFSSVILVMLLGQSRVFYSMSHDGLVPKIFSDVHPKKILPMLFFDTANFIRQDDWRRRCGHCHH